MTTNGSRGTKAEDPLWFLKNTGKGIVEDYQQAIDQAIEKSLAIQEAQAKFGNPATADIEVRHEGLLHRENAEDRKRADAKKANHDRKVLSADHIKELGGFAASGEQFVMDVAEHLGRMNADRPDYLQPLGNTLTKACVQVLSGALIEAVKFNAETGFQEIARATMPRQQQ